MPGLKILYVEDEPDIREIAKIAMRSLGGFEIRDVTCGADALLMAVEFQPDLLLLDVMMPGMSGPETLAKLRGLASTKSVPVIFMTAKVQGSEIAEYLALGAIGVISKPFNPMELASQIKALWEKHKGTSN